MTLLWKVVYGEELWDGRFYGRREIPGEMNYLCYVHPAPLAMGAWPGQVDWWVNTNGQQDVGASVFTSLPISTHSDVLSGKVPPGCLSQDEIQSLQRSILFSPAYNEDLS